MRRHINKGAAVGFLALVALWIVGLAREASVAHPLPTAWHLAVSEELSNRLSRNVIANNLKQIGLAQTPLVLVLDQPDVEKIQVEEKTAQLALGSDAFDDDEAAIRTALAAHHGIVFDEKRSDIAPARRLLLEISVSTDEFDALLEGKLAVARSGTDEKKFGGPAAAQTVSRSTHKPAKKSTQTFS